MLSMTFPCRATATKPSWRKRLPYAFPSHSAWEKLYLTRFTQPPLVSYRPIKGMATRVCD